MALHFGVRGLVTSHISHHQVYRAALVAVFLTIGCHPRGAAKDVDTSGAAARTPGAIDSASALRLGQRALLPLPWADSLIASVYVASDSGYEFALKLPEPKDPNVYNLAGGVVFVRRDGSIRVLEHYR